MKLQRIVDSFVLFIKGNKVLYKWHLKYKGINSLLPNVATDLYMAGYARSGNTFASNLLSILFPGLNVATHIHTVSAIKLAYANSVPVIVIIRDPAECIPSGIIKHKPTLFRPDTAMTVIREYNDYYNYIEKNMSKLVVLEFDSLIEDWREGLVDIVSHATNSKMYTIEEVSSAVNVVTMKMKSDTRPASQNTWGSQQKEELKKQVRARIQNNPEYICAINLFNRIKSNIDYK